MPPSGPKLGVQSGSDGDDWKCRNVFGRANDGVGGMASRVGRLGLEGVMMLRPRLFGLFFGGVGGLTKAGDGGAELRSGSDLSCGLNGAVEIARPSRG